MLMRIVLNKTNLFKIMNQHGSLYQEANKHYRCCLESGRDFMILATDDMDAAYTAYDEAALMGDYLIDVIPVD